MKKKYRIESFILFDYAGVEKHLEKMAQKGWFLTEIQDELWCYERREPAKIRYSVTYIPTVSAHDPVQNDDQTRLDTYCEIAGWTKVTDWFQMQIYCTENPDITQIETDEVTRLDVIRRSMKKTFLFSNILMISVFLIQGWSKLVSIKANPVSFWSDVSNIYIIALIVFGLLFIGINLLYYVIWILQSKKSIEAGGSCVPVRYYRQFNYVSIVIAIVGVLLYFISLNKQLGLLVLIGYLGFLGIRFLVQKTRIVLRKKGVDRVMNIVLTLVVDFIMVIILIAGLSWAVLRYSDNNPEPAGTYQIENTTWEIYKDEIPVKVEDLLPVEYNHYSYEMNEESESPFLSRHCYMQSSFPDGQDAPSMSYEVIKVKKETLYERCLHEYLSKYELHFSKFEDYEEMDIGFKRMNQSAWENAADMVYRFYYDGEPANEYLICKDNLIIWLLCDWEMTEEQFEILVDGVS